MSEYIEYFNGKPVRFLDNQDSNLWVNVHDISGLIEQVDC